MDKFTLSDMTEAFGIFAKYEEGGFSLSGQLNEICVNPYIAVSPEDISRLMELGFYPDEDNQGWFLFRTK